ncbi:MAG: peptide chain release factor N(5)-glutamine methyltransferase [Desulfitobacteriaceae bacterium]|nr:peptide chain release factor N(5)-glutamine methyltransferase [Desulfitobacteriaceae bacterium]
MNASCAQIIARAEKELAAAEIKSARMEAAILLAYSLGIEYKQLLTRLTEPIPQEAKDKFYHLLKRRTEHYPLQYLTGNQEFMSLKFEVNENVLIPRWDTERMVELVLEKLAGYAQPQVVDVGTGSGAIIISLAKFFPQGKFYAVDISCPALKVAVKNARLHVVEERITFIEGDLLSPFLSPEKVTSLVPGTYCPLVSEGNKFDFVISNPPYIPKEEINNLPADVRQEPSLALDGGEDGLDLYRRLIPQASRVLRPGGHLFLEIGYHQAETVVFLCQSNGFSGTRVFQDYAGQDRMVYGWFQG